ncbi:unnamed protein product [Adineta ricciae]|uniref:EH domain-containing protein n=1 Tax=Adineta ricciae TaxID=249248 RepID=A0A814PF04_ADIRI|nr:unnamed protein product [Adineta ricciae]CAF1275648.1 unnamed protein product [Adineta ricciae]
MMDNEDKTSFDKNMFQQMSSSHSSSTSDQDEIIARRKLEQKRRFQQKQGNAHKDADSLMQSMFSDFKLQPKPLTQNTSEENRSIPHISVLKSNTVTQQSQPHVSAPGAADWSKIVFDDELKTVFHQEENIPVQNLKQSITFHHSTEQTLPASSFVYPSWCLQPIVFLPLVYQQVFEASCVSNVIQTSVLYPILLLSGLRQDQLSQIWSQVNLTQPGTLSKEELFMALALIALAQNTNGQIYPNEYLCHLTDIPVPHFQIQQEQKQAQPPAPTPQSVYHQDDFADFTSFEQIEQTNESTNGVTLLDFEENHLYPPDMKTTSSETQSIASLELPMPITNINHQDNTSQKGNSDNVSYSSSSNTNDVAATIDTQSIHSIPSTEPSKLELTQFSFFSDDTSHLDSHMTVWLRCFEKCRDILSQANEIFSSIESPTLCTEVLQQTRTRDYVQHLQEIFHVHKRIYTAAVVEPTTTNQLTSLWKEIIVLWMNLQSFFSTTHLHLLNGDDIDYSSLLMNDTSSYCSICLLSTVGLDSVLPNSSSSLFNTACLTFAGRLYHAPCANFYLNLIDGILPSLRRSS